MAFLSVAACKDDVGRMLACTVGVRERLGFWNEYVQVCSTLKPQPSISAGDNDCLSSQVKVKARHVGFAERLA